MRIRSDALAYIDDSLVSISPEDLAQAWPCITGHLARAGLTLVPHKCAAYVPAATEEESRVTAHVPQRMDGLPLLGSAVQGASKPSSAHSHWLWSRR